MPTARHRYHVTETDEVARALDAAEARWPGEPRAKLILRLITENGAFVGEVNLLEVKRRRAAVHTLAGSFAGLYRPGYVDELRAEWPE